MARESRVLLPLRDGELAALIRADISSGFQLDVVFGVEGAALKLDLDDMPRSRQLATRVDLTRGMAHERGGGI